MYVRAHAKGTNRRNIGHFAHFFTENMYIFVFLAVMLSSLAIVPSYSSANGAPPDSVRGTCESDGCHQGAKWATLIVDAPSEVPKEYSFEFKLVVKNSWTNPKYEIRDAVATLDLSKSPNIALGDGESATKDGPSTIKAGSSYTFTWKLKSRSQGDNVLSVSVSFVAHYDHSDSQYPDDGSYTYTKQYPIKIGSSLIKNALAYTPPPVPLISVGVIFAFIAVLFWDGGALEAVGKRLVSDAAKRALAKKIGSIASVGIAFIYMLVIIYFASSGRLPINLSASGFILVATVGCIGLMGLGKLRLGDSSRTVATWICLVAVLFIFEHWSVFGLNYNAVTLQWITGRFVGWISAVLLIVSIFTGGTIKTIGKSLNKALGGAANRVSVHCFVSLLIVGLSIFHALMLMLGWYLGRTTGLTSGLIAFTAFTCLGVTGTFQVAICKKIGHSSWRSIHFWLTMLSTIIVIQHAVTNGTSLAFLRY